MHPVHNFLPYFPEIHSNVIFHPHVGLLHGLFTSGFLTKILYVSCLPCMCYMPQWSQYPWFDHSMVLLLWRQILCLFSYTDL
jgi:hypothetical protein